MDAVAEQPMDSMFGHRRLAAGPIVVRSCLGIDDGVAAVAHPSDAIATVSLMSAFVQLDLVAAVLVLVLPAHPRVVRELGEPNKIVVAADSMPMFVAVVAVFCVLRSKKWEGMHEYI